MREPHVTGRAGRTRRLLLAGIPAGVLLGLLGAAVFSAHRAVQRATETNASRDQIGFSLKPLDPGSSQTQNPGFEPVASAPEYNAGVFFEGKLYLSGPAGLTVVGGEGKARTELRTGFELPVASIAGVAKGRLRGMMESEILLATQGAGLLLLEPGAHGAPTLRQMLPGEADARDMSALLPLASGDLLLGTRHGGVLLYDGAALRRFGFALAGVNPAALQVTVLAAVDSASFLIGTRNAGVFYAHAGRVEQANAGSGMPDDQVESICVQGSRAFVGTPVGTAEFDLTVPGFRPERTVGRGLFSHALAVEAGELSIGTLDQGVRQIRLDDGGQLHRVSISAGPTRDVHERIDAFLSAPDGVYALADGRLVRRGGLGWTPALAGAGSTLTDRNVSALAFGPDGTLYVGFFDHGMDLLSPEGGIRHLEDDALFCVNRLALDPERHTMAAATANGLVLFDAKGAPRQTLTRRDGLISDHITDIVFTNTGVALATPGGITFLRSTGAESLYAFQGLVNNHVYALASGGSGELLAGTLGGLSMLRSAAVERNLTVANSGLKHNWITALLPLGDSTTLVGTYGGGLQTMDSAGRFSAVELPAGAPRDLVINPNALFATSKHVYAGMLGHGLLVYSNATGRWAAMAKGLPSLNVTAFAARNGVVYMGTDNGLVRIAEGSVP